MLTSKELYEKVDKLRIQKGYTVAKLNSLAGISHSTLNSWKQRGTMPKLEVLESICYALDISVASLIYDVDTDKFSGEEIELISYWRSIDEELKRDILSIIKNMANKS